MRGLLLKVIWETRLPTLLFGLALGIVMLLLTRIIPQMQREIEQLLSHLPLAKSMMAALMGIDVKEELNAQVLQAFVWVHPAVLSLIWGHEIVFCTRLPAAEIDSGTVDVLLGLPVSRRSLYLAESAGWLVSGLVILAMGAAGYSISARQIAPDMRPNRENVLMVLLNLYCVYVAVGGWAFFVSSCGSRRAPAIAVVFALLLASFLLTFLARFWWPASQLEFLSVLHYYQPAQVLRTGSLPPGDVAALLAAGAAGWIAGGEIFTRRDICTV